MAGGAGTDAMPVASKIECNAEPSKLLVEERVLQMLLPSPVVLEIVAPHLPRRRLLVEDVPLHKQEQHSHSNLSA